MLWLFAASILTDCVAMDEDEDEDVAEACLNGSELDERRDLVSFWAEIVRKASW